MEFLITIFIFIALSASLFVISATNPIHSVFALIRLFVRSTGLLFTLHADFLAIILLVVYVGAIAVLFLFVIMMLHLNLLTIQSNNLLRYLPISIIMGFILLLSFIGLSNDMISLKNDQIDNYINWPLLNTGNSINLFSEVLYSKYRINFIIRSLILFVAMIGAIVITHRLMNSKKQDANNQLLRRINC